MPRNRAAGLFVSQTEHSGVYGQHTAGSGGHIARPSQSQYQPLPFTSCAISLQPWNNPVCDREEGTIYELTNILPWIKKHGRSPATGKPLKAADLITLHFHKNEATNAFQDPVSFKAFNDSTHLVAIATSGNVFAYDTVQQLNIKAKFWSDLLTGESFNRKDLIILQDPNNVSGKSIANLYHLKEGLALTAEDKGESQDTEEVNVAATGSARGLLKKIREQTEGAKKAKVEAGEAALEKMKRAASEAAGSPSISKAAASSSTIPRNAGIGTTGKTSASFTSTGLTPSTKLEREIINEDEMMYEDIKKGQKGKGPYKGYVRMVTNFGPLNIELHCDKAPKTCHNFLTLCQRGVYTSTTFHRNIPGFMVQGGDPTGTGRGGESMWGKPFADELTAPGAYKHTARGVISMANRGPDTNTSQFFILYAAKPHLDKKHTVFGQLVDSPSATLDALELVPTEPGTDKPMRTIRILDVQVFADPFADYQDRLNRKLLRQDESEVAKREAKRRKREEDRTTWLGTNLGSKDEPQAMNGDDAVASLTSGPSGVGRYLDRQRPSKLSTAPTDDLGGAGEPGSSKKRKEGRGFADFSGW